MKKALACLALAGLFFAVAATLSLRAPVYNTQEQQVKEGITAPISLCGSPGARVILKLMDTTRQMAPLLSNLGDYQMKVTTTVERAQLFFNQGINLYYGFNHLEAYRSFKEAARLDPTMAMAYWGQALALGPNINLPMDPADGETVFAAIQRAKSLMDNASAKEKALINALSLRYTRDAMAERKPLDEAYAAAMKEVAQEFHDDLDVRTLYAEARMDLHPWDYWKDGQPRAWTPETVAIIDGVIKQMNDHPGANHLNIHILEASPNPDQAVASADRLRNLVPGAGHLVHMPSHIYIRVGRYIEGVEANERAVKTDQDYITQCKVQGVYPLFYYPHNYHFLLACAQMAGMSAKSEATARALQETIPTALLTEPDFVTLQHWYAMPWYTAIRFGQWDKVLKIERPADSLLYMKGAWHYVRGIAMLRKGNVDEAGRELEALRAAVAMPEMEKLTIAGFNSFAQVLGIGRDLLEGEILAHDKRYEESVLKLRQAVASEDELLYQEPPDWFLPSRQVLGSVLLKAGKPAEAEEAFRNDLGVYRDNGWSLLGLAQSLEAQGKKMEANAVRNAFRKSFAQADIKPPGAVF